MNDIEQKLWCEIYVRRIDKGDTEFTAKYRADESVILLRKSSAELTVVNIPIGM